MIKIEKPDPKKIDEIKQWEVWEKEPCTFDHDQQKTESFYIIEGKASLSTDKGINVDIYVFNLNVENKLADNTLLNQNDIKIIPYTYFEEQKQSCLD